jgi:hypothetical protein
MVWEFDPIDWRNTKTDEAILKVLLDIREVLADMSGAIDGIYHESAEQNGTHIG